MNDINSVVNDYLYYGYIPSRRSDDTAFKNVFYENIDSQDKTDFEEYVSAGMRVINDVFDDLIQGKDQKKHIVPLSGGLDSRLILAALLERIDNSKIQVVTFGTPASLDYEIPSLITKKYKLSHKKINCTSLDYSIENLVSASLEGGRWTSVPDNYINRLAFNTEKNCCKWSGFMGGEIAGDYSHLNSDNEDNYKLFSKYQKRVKNLQMIKKDYNPKSSLRRVNQSINSLNEFELIFYLNRSIAGSSSIINTKSKDLLIPFMHPKWVSFISNVPKQFRAQSVLFRTILTRMYPDIFNLPCKNKGGLSLNSKSKLKYLINYSKLKARYELVKIFNSVHFPPIGVNYLFYKQAFKEIPSLNQSVIEACQNLERRKIIPWLSPVDILNYHLSGKKDYSDALLILLGLEVNLIAEEKDPTLIMGNKIAL